MDFSKVKVHDKEYNVKDETARTLINNLSRVASTGDYDDLINKPTIPTKTSDLTNDSGYITKNVDDLTNYTKTSDLSNVATSGDYNDLSNKPTIPVVPTNVSAFTNDSGYITKNVNDLTNYTLTSNLSSVATSGSYNDLSDKPTIPVKMSILKYGISTWNDFINAYNENAIVYCRASSNSNPATGSQTRMAFMAYINNETTPTEVEFQYYRSVSSHSDSQQGDQVFVYKLNKTSGWSVTNRNTFTKIIAGTNLSSSYSSGNLTINNTLSVPTKTSDLTNDSGYITNTVNNLTNYTKTSDLPSLNIYSTNETEIGKWIDNKTIYRKVFTATGNNSNNQGIAYLDDYDTITHLEVWLKNGSISRNGFANWYGGSSWSSQVYINTGWIGLECGNDYTSFKDGASITVVVEYTKN